MPSITNTLLLATMATLSLAMTVTSPTKHQLWDSSKSNTITWSSVSTDPKTVDIYLAHMAAHPPLYSLLFSDVSTSTGSAVVSNLQLPNGEAYQINLVASDNENQILAQSQQFNVTGEAVAGATSTIAGYTGATYTPTASGTKSATKSASLTTVTSTGTNSTATGTSTATSEEAESTESVSGSSTVSRPSQTVGAASGTASATRTGNAAAGNYVATGSMMAMFFGAAAFLA